MTVNDLLILYRCEFGHEYTPSPKLEAALDAFQQSSHPKRDSIYQLIKTSLDEAKQNNPSIVIPMEATAAHPRERLYPTTFRNPLVELWGHFQTTMAALNDYAAHQDQERWVTFAQARRTLLAQLNYFGQIMRAYKRVALEGGSTSTATIKLMGHLPPGLLKLLDEIPQRIDILNEVIKGDEVFSNVGRVAHRASISRFISAKDDNDNKDMVWAVVTDDSDVLQLAIRDFRPHVRALLDIDRQELAELLLDDYLDSFVENFNDFVKGLLKIINTKATHSAVEDAQ